jgi:hypothetical protein
MNRLAVALLGWSGLVFVLLLTLALFASLGVSLSFLALIKRLVGLARNRRSSA